MEHEVGSLHGVRDGNLHEAGVDRIQRVTQGITMFLKSVKWMCVLKVIYVCCCDIWKLLCFLNILLLTFSYLVI